MNLNHRPALLLIFLFSLYVLSEAVLNVIGGGSEPVEAASIQSDVLKHRVQVVAVPPDRTEKEGITTFVLETEGWKALLLEEGISISKDEWASALDLLRTETASSSVFRLVKSGIGVLRKGGTQGHADSDSALPPLFLLARFGVGTSGNRVFVNLVDGSTGNTILTADDVAESMQEAIRKALVELEEEAALMPWRCRVVGQTKNAIVIDRGYLDGLRKGQQLIGYSMNPEAKKHVGMAPELLIMQFGTRRGSYEISDEGQEFAKATPVAGAPLLSDGDFLELPAIRIPDRQRDNRGRRVWDKLYDR
ncbi:MAG: hypothetical protein JRJ47_09890 [Deltaproteobacteria bacterium]|nr:hypothetical protein [Deltaproteobacteria bacterium]